MQAVFYANTPYFRKVNNTFRENYKLCYARYRRAFVSILVKGVMPWKRNLERYYQLSSHALYA